MKKPVLTALLLGLVLPVSADAALLAHEPFNYLASTIHTKDPAAPGVEVLTGKGGTTDFGFTGTWTAATSGTSPFQTFDIQTVRGVHTANVPNTDHWDGSVLNGLATSGGWAGHPGLDNTHDHNRGNRKLDPSVTASFVPGTSTWISWIIRTVTSTQPRANLAIGSGTLAGDRGNATTGGPAIGGGSISTDATGSIRPQVWTNNSSGTRGAIPAPGALNGRQAAPNTNLTSVYTMVMRIDWAGPGTNDTVWIMRFENAEPLELATFNSRATSLGFDFDQSTFDTLSFHGARYNIDEIRLGTTFEDVVPRASTAPVLKVGATGPDLTFTWNSKLGQTYTLRNTGDLVSPPGTWGILQSELPATPPTNTFTVARPAAFQQFFVVEELLRPAAFLDDFESGLGGWTVGSDGGTGTAWELGTPRNVGPTAAHSPTRCFGSNISTNYNYDANIWLRSPAIDLTTASRATLEFWHFLATWTGGADFGSVRVLDAADQSVLAVLAAALEGVTPGWVRFAEPLPSGVLGRRIQIEFRFQSAFDGMPGWYIDDVGVFLP